VKSLPTARVAQLLRAFRRRRVLVFGDVMLDQFVHGRVRRISPEAPVPVVEFERESFMPGGAANVARNLTSLGARAEMVGVIGRDAAGVQLRGLLEQHRVDCSALFPSQSRMTIKKTRIIAHQQQVARVDRERILPLTRHEHGRLWDAVSERLPGVDAVIVGDYGKGLVTQAFLDQLTMACRERGVWLSLDPKPIHALELGGLSLLTPNRKEAFELAGRVDDQRQANPLVDAPLLEVADCLLQKLKPALLLVTLGDQGMLLCQRGEPAVYIPTAAREVFDVSGAGDTVIGAFTLAVAAGASPLEAAILSNHAAGVVVGKFGTATVSPGELAARFRRSS